MAKGRASLTILTSKSDDFSNPDSLRGRQLSRQTGLCARTSVERLRFPATGNGGPFLRPRRAYGPVRLVQGAEPEASDHVVLASTSVTTRKSTVVTDDLLSRSLCDHSAVTSSGLGPSGGSTDPTPTNPSPPTTPTPTPPSSSPEQSQKDGGWDFKKALAAAALGLAAAFLISVFTPAAESLREKIFPPKSYTAIAITDVDEFMLSTPHTLHYFFPGKSDFNQLTRPPGWTEDPNIPNIVSYEGPVARELLLYDFCMIGPRLMANKTSFGRR